MHHQEDDTTADWDDALLFEVAVDPFRRTAVSGKEDGRAAGLRDGYLEGVAVGRSKGWEIGLELGYVHDFARGILDGHRRKSERDDGVQEENRTSHRLERCLALSRDLVRMIDEFPDPDSLLTPNRGDHVALSMNSTMNEDRKVISEGCRISSDAGDLCEGGSVSSDCCNTSSPLQSQDGHGDNTSPTGGNDIKAAYANEPVMLDVYASLERIRAKFKLLTVLLKTKQPFDLKRVLELGDGGSVAAGGEGVDEKPSSGALLEDAHPQWFDRDLKGEGVVSKGIDNESKTKFLGGIGTVRTDW